MNATWIPLLAATLVVVAVLLLSAVVIQYQSAASKRRSLAQVLSIGAITPANEAFARSVNASVIQATVSGIADRFVTESNRKRLKRHLAWAGKPNAEDVRAAVERKILYGLAGLCLGFLFGVLHGGLGWLAMPFAALVGYYLPDVLAYNAAVHRTEEIQRTLPDSLDLLNMCVESGLSLQAGLARVAQTQSGAVAEEFGRVLQELQLGVARSDAFEALGKRTKQEDMQRFVAAMLQVDRLGIPVSSVLREQASEMRAKRHSRAREQAQKVPVKILAPLMLCFLPGLFIIILGPAVITALDTFAGM